VLVAIAAADWLLWQGQAGATTRLRKQFVALIVAHACAVGN